MQIRSLLDGSFFLDVPQSASSGKWLMAMAFNVCGAGAALTVTGLLSLRDVVLRDIGPKWMIAIDVALLLIGLAVIAWGNFIYRASLRHFATIIFSPEEVYEKSFTLYLRPFADDLSMAKLQRLPALSTAARIWFSVGRTEEEQLAAVLASVGPMVAVGMPGERLPHVGATRMYLPAEDWQDPVRELMLRARLVVLALGPGAGTMWEMTEAMRILPPERLLLVVPMEREEYESFRSAAEAELRARAKRVRRDTGKRWSPPRLPDYAGHTEISSRIQGLIYFSSSWEPTFIRLWSYSSFHNFLRDCLDRAILPAAMQLGAYERREAEIQPHSFEPRDTAGHSVIAGPLVHGRMPRGSMGMVNTLWSTGTLQTTFGMAIMLGLLVWLVLDFGSPSVSIVTWIALLLVSRKRCSLTWAAVVE